MSSFDRIAKRVAKDTKRYTFQSLDIVDQIQKYLDDEHLSQKDLADKLGKSESEISRWMTGLHNFSIKTISKIEAELDVEILVTPLRLEMRKYEEKLIKAMSMPVSIGLIERKIGSMIKIRTDRVDELLFNQQSIISASIFSSKIESNKVKEDTYGF